MSHYTKSKRNLDLLATALTWRKTGRHYMFVISDDADFRSSANSYGMSHLGNRLGGHVNEIKGILGCASENMKAGGFVIDVEDVAPDDLGYAFNLVSYLNVPVLIIGKHSDLPTLQQLSAWETRDVAIIDEA